LIIVLFVGVLLFGSKRLPDAARSVGKSMRIFKSEVKELQADSTTGAVTPAQPATQVAAERVEAPVTPPGQTDIRPV